jgi:TorA maturation chaperone TorD
MTATATADATRADLASRQVITAALAAAMIDPHGSQPSPHHHDTSLLQAAWSLIGELHQDTEKSSLGLGELAPANVDIGPLIDWLATSPQRRAEVFQQVFGLVISRICPPHECEFCHWKDPTYRANQLADIAGFYRAFGVEPGGAKRERDDHIALELSYLALLYDYLLMPDDDDRAEREAVCHEAMVNFTRDHIAWWVPTFGRCLEHRIDQLLEAGPDPALHALRGVSMVLRSWAAAQRLHCDVEPSTEIIAPQVELPDTPLSDENCGGCECGG